MRAWARCAPIKPAPPVISLGIMILLLLVSRMDAPFLPLPYRLPARSRFGEGRGEGAGEGETVGIKFSKKRTKKERNAGIYNLLNSKNKFISSLFSKNQIRWTRKKSSLRWKPES